MVQATLDTIDYALMGSGGLVTAAVLLSWCRRACVFGRSRALPPSLPRAHVEPASATPVQTAGAVEILGYARPVSPLPGRGGRLHFPWLDPLRGSPLRTNRLGLVLVWLCIAATFAGWSLGGPVGARMAPGLKGDELQNWQGIVGAHLAAILNAATGLLVARAVFTGGLRGFGIGRRRLDYELAMGVAGWLQAIFLTGVILIATEWVIRRFFPHFVQPEHGVIIALRDPAIRPWMQVFTVTTTVLLVPIGEEVLFRGILQTAFQKLVRARWGSLRHRWVAVVAAGSLFGLMHLNTPQNVPALIALGILLGLLYERSGSLIVPILVHMLFNGRTLLWDHLLRPRRLTLAAYPTGTASRSAAGR